MRMPAAHISNALRVGWVSKSIKSAPPSSRLATCSAIISSYKTLDCGWEGRGPIEPATNMGRPAASATSRAIDSPDAIYLPQLLGKSEPGQRHSIRAEGVRG